MGELRRVEPLRDGRKRSDVAEQQRQFTLQAAELERSGHFRQARDHRRRDKPAKGGTDLALLMALHRIERRHSGKIDRSGGKRRIGRLDQHSVTRKREPAHCDDRGEHGRIGERRQVRPQDPGRHHERGTDHRRRHPLRARRPIRPPERLAAQELLDDLRMGLNARHRCRQRGRDDVREHRCGGAEEHDRAAKVAEVRSRGRAPSRRRSFGEDRLSRNRL